METNFGLETGQPSDLKQLKEMVNELAEKRELYAEEKKRLSEKNQELEELEIGIKRIMEAAGIERFDADTVTVFRKEKTSVRMPKTPEQREALFNYLREQGIFEQLVSINSQTLQSWYKHEVEARETAGQVGNIPGIEDVTTYTDLWIRKK
jgi:transcriptional regulator of heat shock response